MIVGTRLPAPPKPPTHRPAHPRHHRYRSQISCLRPSSRGEERVGNAATSSSSLLERDAARRRSRYALASTSGLLGRAWQAFSEGASDFLLVKD